MKASLDSSPFSPPSVLPRGRRLMDSPHTTVQGSEHEGSLRLPSSPFLSSSFSASSKGSTSFPPFPTQKGDAPSGHPLSVIFISMATGYAFLCAFSECRQITLPNPALQKASFAFPEGNAPARYRYQRLATRIRAMALVSASSARWTSVSGLGSARRSSARALACSALSTSMSEASSAASARMVTLLSAI